MQPYFHEEPRGSSTSSPWSNSPQSALGHAGDSGAGSARYSDLYATEQKRLRRLLWLLAILLVAFLTPFAVGRIAYHYTYNEQLAKVQVAKEQLGTLELEGLSLASRLIAGGVGPSVVHIRSTQLAVPRNLRNDERQFLWGNPDHWETEGDGSGVIVDREGYIVTNHHVVERATAIKVVLSDGREADANVIGSDEVTDIAVLKIDLPNLHAAEWGDSGKLEIGDLVWAMGSPFGLKQSTTFGIISAKDRRGVSRTAFLQTDAAVNPGNSGGPLIGTDGKIIGINTAIVGTSFQGVSFAIPSKRAREIYETIRAKGEVAHGWLGVSLGTITPEMAERMRVPISGAMVMGVVADSPADRAGFQPADFIIRWNGHDVADPTDLTHYVVDTIVGAEVDVVFLRGGRERTATVTVGKRPPMSENRNR